MRPDHDFPLPASDHATSDSLPRLPTGQVDHAALQERALLPMQNAELRAFEAAEERAEALIAECEARAPAETDLEWEGRRERLRERLDREADEAHFRRIDSAR